MPWFGDVEWKAKWWRRVACVFASIVLITGVIGGVYDSRKAFAVCGAAFVLVILSIFKAAGWDGKERMYLQVWQKTMLTPERLRFLFSPLRYDLATWKASVFLLEQGMAPTICARLPVQRNTAQGWEN